VPRRPQGDGYKKSIREIGAIRGFVPFVSSIVFFRGGKIDKMV
jgi:hypothetical protein